MVWFRPQPVSSRGFPGDSVIKNLPAKAGGMVLSLSREDHLQKERSTPSSILAWKIPWTEEPGRLLSPGSQKSPISLSD